MGDRYGDRMGDRMPDRLGDRMPDRMSDRMGPGQPGFMWDEKQRGEVLVYNIVYVMSSPFICDEQTDRVM